jgi:hypothetical protein
VHLWTYSPFSYPVEKICRFDKLRPERIKTYIWTQSLPIEPFRKKTISFPNVIMPGVSTNGFFNVPEQNLSLKMNLFTIPPFRSISLVIRDEFHLPT